MYQFGVELRIKSPISVCLTGECTLESADNFFGKFWTIKLYVIYGRSKLSVILQKQFNPYLNSFAYHEHVSIWR